MNYENFVGAIEGLAKKFHSSNPGMYAHVNRTDYGLEVTCMPCKEMRRNWVDQMMTECDNYDTEVILCDPNRKVLVAYFDSCWSYDEDGYGVAKCSPDDEFDEEIGLAVAFAHFREYPIPDFV